MNFWKRLHYVLINAALVVSGNIPADDLKRIAESKFGAWKGGDLSTPQIAAAESTAAKIVIVDRPGAQQTMMRMMQLGVSRSTPDFTPRSK